MIKFLSKIKEIDFLNSFDEIFYISALKKTNTDKILKYIEKNTTQTTKNIK